MKFNFSSKLEKSILSLIEFRAEYKLSGLIEDETSSILSKSLSVFEISRSLSIFWLIKLMVSSLFKSSICSFMGVKSNDDLIWSI